MGRTTKAKDSDSAPFHIDPFRALHLLPTAPLSLIHFAYTCLSKSSKISDQAFLKHCYELINTEDKRRYSQFVGIYLPNNFDLDFWNNGFLIAISSARLDEHCPLTDIMAASNISPQAKGIATLAYSLLRKAKQYDYLGTKIAPNAKTIEEYHELIFRAKKHFNVTPKEQNIFDLLLINADT